VPCPLRRTVRMGHGAVAGRHPQWVIAQCHPQCQLLECYGVLRHLRAPRGGEGGAAGLSRRPAAYQATACVGHRAACMHAAAQGQGLAAPAAAQSEQLQTAGQPSSPLPSGSGASLQAAAASRQAGAGHQGAGQPAQEGRHIARGMGGVAGMVPLQPRQLHWHPPGRAWPPSSPGSSTGTHQCCRWTGCGNWAARNVPCTAGGVQFPGRGVRRKQGGEAFLGAR
jgi:hypothetical protein